MRDVIRTSHVHVVSASFREKHHLELRQAANAHNQIQSVIDRIHGVVEMLHPFCAVEQPGEIKQQFEQRTQSEVEPIISQERTLENPPSHGRLEQTVFGQDAQRGALDALEKGCGGEGTQSHAGP